MKTILSLIATCLVITSYCADFHVAMDGDDDNIGSQLAPWKSIQYAMEVASPGSTVYIHQGTYNEPLYLEVSGREGEQIIFKNFQEEEVLIDAEGFSSSSIIEVYNKSYVTIEGFTIQNHQKLDAIGILLEGDCKGISIVNCTIRNINFSKDVSASVSEHTNSQPLIVYGTEPDFPVQDLVIRGNKIYNCRTGHSEALAINGNVSNFLVEFNEIYNISNIGIDIIGHEGTCEDPSKDQARNGIIRGNKTYNCRSPYATSAGIYVDGGASLIIEGNQVFDNQWGIEIGCENIGKSTEDVIVRNNLVYKNQSSGLHIGGYDYPHGSGKVQNCQVLNNTFFGNDLENDGSGEIYLSYNEGFVFMNNIVSSDNLDGTILSTEDLNAVSSGLEISYNDWYNLNEKNSGYFYFEGRGYDNLELIQSTSDAFSNNFAMDPLFYSDTDFHLKAESKLIDQGVISETINYGTEDFDGFNRVIGSGIDLGAFEYGSTTSGMTELSSDYDIMIYPNPASNFICLQGNVKDVTAIKIYDILGRQVMSKENTNEKVDIRQLKQGHYLINLFQERRLLASKMLLIQH